MIVFIIIFIIYSDWKWWSYILLHYCCCYSWLGNKITQKRHDESKIFLQVKICKWSDSRWRIFQKKVHIYIQNLFIIDVHLGKENSLRMGMLLIFIFYFFPFGFGFFFFYLFFLSFLKPRVRIVSFFVALLRPDPLSVDISGQ